MSTEGGVYLGIMSGTSLDGIDCVIAAFNDKPNPLAFYTHPIPPEIRQELMAFATAHLIDTERFVRMHFVLAQLYADAVHQCIQGSDFQPSNIVAIGLHGQTVRHLPKKVFFHSDFAPIGATFQLGSGAALAALTGIDVVHDFRAADVAMGGEGAPLVPMFDKRFLFDPTKDRVVLNIGGIANITYLPRWEQGIMAFDTGPGNMVIDALATKFFSVSYDKDGLLAAQGDIKEDLLAQLLKHHYFTAPPPKSTGRELFGEEFLQPFFDEIASGTLEAQDALRTATELTARTIAEGIHSVHPAVETLEVISSGGGTNNIFLMQRLQQLLAPATIVGSNAYGIPAQWKEALAFAFFAKAFLDGDRIHLPQTTGAERQLILGSLSKGR